MKKHSSLIRTLVKSDQKIKANSSRVSDNAHDYEKNTDGLDLFLLKNKLKPSMLFSKSSALSATPLQLALILWPHFANVCNKLECLCLA